MTSPCNNRAFRIVWALTILGLLHWSLPFAHATPQESLATTMTIPDGTPVHLILLDDLNSKKNRDGDVIRFKVRESVRVGGVDVIPAGAQVVGHVSAVGHSGFAGHSGKLGLAIDHAVAVNGARVPLRGEALLKGGSNGAVTAAATVYWGPPALLMRGWEADIHKGTMLNAYVNGNQTVALSNTPSPTQRADTTSQLGLTISTWEGGGAQITQVAPNSPAQAAGLQAGYVIHSVDRRKVLTAEEFEMAVGDRASGTTIVIGCSFRSTALGWMPKEVTLQPK